MEIDDLAAHARRFFETFHRPGEPEEIRRWRFKERRPIWLVNMMRENVHDRGRWLPDDYKFSFTVDALELLEEGTDPDEPRLEPDVYTQDLMQWLASHSERPGYVDESVNEFGWNKEQGIVGAIAGGQLLEKEEVFRSVVEGLRERLEAIEAGEPEKFEKGGKAEDPRTWSPRG